MAEKELMTDMQKMAGMSTEEYESLNFYKYLCRKIGSEEVVKIRRLTTTMIDMGQTDIFKNITSGSKGEGLYFKSSDLDIMGIDPFFKVYQSEKEANFDGLFIPLIMNTEETLPCFTQLRLPNYFHFLLPSFKNKWQRTHLGYMFSSENYKLVHLSIYPPKMATMFTNIHGPCVSDTNDAVDIAFCLKCDQWIFQAQPWVSRSRSTWPSPELISKIISCGVLFVPIGCKGSANENLEWRISFSVAEKFLIYSFSHTQLLCYALLKILLKEIVEKHEDLKGLLCSYFLKTLMFWISEETDQNLWKPDNIITCFLSCLQRLLYCVKYSILPHYFIPDNNFFCARFNVMNKEKLITILKNSNEQGINCFKSSETLQDYPRLSFQIPESFAVIRIIPETFSYFPSIKNMRLLYHFLHSSRTGLSRGLFALHLSNACKFALDASKHRYSSENKHQYLKYKYDLSHLLIGVNSDAVSGWLTLASFFYVHKNYVASLSVVNYTLQKYTDEKFYTVLTTTEDTLNRFQKQELNLMKKEKLYTIYKTLTIFPLQFYYKSSIIPQELQVDVDVTNNHAKYHPIGFAYFLSFLCYYHRQDIISCRHFLQLLKSTITYPSLQANFDAFTCSPLFCGIAHQLLGETNLARQIFQLCAMFDPDNLTSRASRLQGLI
ncbi:uncharacterized protein [Mytilus edulis]|uniref:uncharacterized protein n=1 Tax=Mytilus edulis TaxID=6550 RepID=UPI0039EF58B9